MSSLKETSNLKMFLFGVSYGSFWSSRFLQIFPNFIDAVVLDGVAPPQQLEFVTYDYYSNNVGIMGLNLCKKNPTCSTKIPDPESSLKTTFKHIEQREFCQDAIGALTSERLKRLFFQFIAATQNKVLIPSLLFRINRCNAQDVTILKHFVSSFESHSKNDYRYFCLPIHQYLLQSKELKWLNLSFIFLMD